MKFIIVLLAIVLVYACTVSSTPSPIRRGRDHRHVLVNRPSYEEMFFSRMRRSDLLQPGVKGRPFIKPEAPILSVRKGEYVCGNKICKLQPGQVPNECIGCQYPIS